MAEQFQVKELRLIWDEVNDFANLLSTFEKAFLTLDSDDEREWLPNAKGNFSVKSFYSY